MNIKKERNSRYLIIKTLMTMLYASFLFFDGKHLERAMMSMLYASDGEGQRAQHDEK